MKTNIDAILQEIKDELIKAQAAYPPFNSAHEGYSVLAEEVDELWQEVKIKQKDRNPVTMQEEAIQIAAMAVRFAYDVCYIQRGKK